MQRGSRVPENGTVDCNVENRLKSFVLRRSLENRRYSKDKLMLDLKKTAAGQTLYIDVPIVTQTIHLTNFKQAVQPLSWAALSQIEVYGRYL